MTLQVSNKTASMPLEVANSKDGWPDYKASRETGLKKNLFAGNKGEYGNEDNLIRGNDRGIKELIIKALRKRFLPIIITKFNVKTIFSIEMIWILLKDYQQKFKLKNVE